MFSIGEFSRITGLTIKTLRLYHEKEILAPHTVDSMTGYRYYSKRNVAKARVIKELRAMEFSLADIKILLDELTDEAEILEALEKQKQNLTEKIAGYTGVLAKLDAIITTEKEAQIMLSQTTYEVQEKYVGDQWIAGIRYKGKYSDCGKAFGIIARKMGRLLCGKPFNLYYDAEYKEADADIESCIPIRKPKEVEGISVRNLPGGKCISLIHKGPYDQLGRSYETIIAYVKQKGYTIKVPSREVYLKGPGMIFKGNPKNYLTEIQMMIEE